MTIEKKLYIYLDKTRCVVSLLDCTYHNKIGSSYARRNLRSLRTWEQKVELSTRFGHSIISSLYSRLIYRFWPHITHFKLDPL